MSVWFLDKQSLQLFHQGCFDPDPVLSAQDHTHEKDTLSLQGVHSVTKGTHLAQGAQQENRWGGYIPQYRAMTLESKDRGGQLEMSGKSTHQELSADAWPRTRVQGMLAVFTIAVMHCEGPWAMGPLHGQDKPLCYLAPDSHLLWKDKGSCRKPLSSLSLLPHPLFSSSVLLALLLGHGLGLEVT